MANLLAPTLFKDTSSNTKLCVAADGCLYTATCIHANDTICANTCIQGFRVGSTQYLCAGTFVQSPIVCGTSCLTVGTLKLTASRVATTATNLHLDALSGGQTYINYYTGTGGTVFGNGASGIVACITGAGMIKGPIVCATSCVKAPLFHNPAHGTLFKGGSWFVGGAMYSGVQGAMGFNFGPSNAATTNTACIYNSHSGGAGYAGILFSGYTHGLEFFTCSGNTTGGTAIATSGSSHANLRMKIDGSGNVTFWSPVVCACSSAPSGWSLRTNGSVYASSRVCAESCVRSSIVYATSDVNTCCLTATCNIYGKVICGTGCVKSPTVCATSCVHANLLHGGWSRGFCILATGNTNCWVKLGNWATVNAGYGMTMKIIAQNGYNANPNQTQVTNMHFKTSNGGSYQAGTGGGNFFADMSVVRCAAYSTKNSSPYFIRAVQVSNTSYDFYACFSAYLSVGSSYRVDAGQGTWTNCSAFIVGATGTYLDVAPVTSGYSKDCVCSPLVKTDILEQNAGASNLCIRTEYSTGKNIILTPDGAGTVIVNGTSNNSGKSDFTVHTGGTATMAMDGGQIWMGADDINWSIRLQSSGNLFAYGQHLVLGTASGCYVKLCPNGGASYACGCIQSPIVCSTTKFKGSCLHIDGAALSQGNDATAYITAASNNDWGLLVDKPSHEYGIDSRVKSDAVYAYAGRFGGEVRYSVGATCACHSVRLQSPIIYGNTRVCSPTVCATSKTYYGATNTSYFCSSGNYAIHQTSGGYIAIGPDNSSWGHILTDRARFYFNKDIITDGDFIGTYDSDLHLVRANHGTSAEKISITAGTTYSCQNTCVCGTIFSPIVCATTRAEINGRIICGEGASQRMILPGSGDNCMLIGPYGDNSWGYILSTNNASGIYFGTNQGNFVFDDANLISYNDGEVDIGVGSNRFRCGYFSHTVTSYCLYATHCAVSPIFCASSCVEACYFKTGNVTLTRSGNGNNLHMNAPAGIIPNSTTTSSNACLGTSGYQWKEIHGAVICSHNCFKSPIVCATTCAEFNKICLLNDVNGDMANGIVLGSNAGIPQASWGASSTSTGRVEIGLPTINGEGGSAHYGMVHVAVDVYEYNARNVMSFIVGGHNWNCCWYSCGAHITGGCTDKTIKVAYHSCGGTNNGRYVILIGEPGSSWCYGSVHVRRVSNGLYYSGAMNFGTPMYVKQVTCADSYYNGTSSDLRASSKSLAGYVCGTCCVRGAIVCATNQICSDGNLTVKGNVICHIGGSPEYRWQTVASHVNWRMAVQETISNAWEIGSGQTDADASNDTFTRQLWVGTDYICGSCCFAAPIVCATTAFRGASYLCFTANTPTICTGGAYISVPSGIHVSGGTLYTENTIMSRNGICDDTGTPLTLFGGNNAEKCTVLCGKTFSCTCLQSPTVCATSNITTGNSGTIYVSNNATNSICTCGGICLKSDWVRVAGTGGVYLSGFTAGIQGGGTGVVCAYNSGSFCSSASSGWGLRTSACIYASGCVKSPIICGDTWVCGGCLCATQGGWSLRTTGCIYAGGYIRGQAWVCSDGYLHAGTHVSASTYMCAGSYMCADSYICAAGGFYGDGSNLTGVGGGLCGCTATATLFQTTLGRCAMLQGGGPCSIAIGYKAAGMAGQFNPTDSNNHIIAIGYEALNIATTANCTVAIGMMAGYDNVGGKENTYVGSKAGQNNDDNVAGGGGVFIGYNAGQCVKGGCGSIFIGANSYGDVCGQKHNCIVIGNTQTGVGSGKMCSSSFNFTGSVSKSSGSFRIVHPNPAKSETKDLWHSFVESPNEGDNIYRYSVDTTDCRYVIELPDYYQYLNKNDQVWVSPVGHFGAAYGTVTEDQECAVICANVDGCYNVLLVGTRKDKAALHAWNGAERDVDSNSPYVDPVYEHGEEDEHGEKELLSTAWSRSMSAYNDAYN